MTLPIPSDPLKAVDESKILNYMLESHKDTVVRRRAIYQELSDALVEHDEFPYLLKRRSLDKSEDKELRNWQHDQQRRLQRAILGAQTESPAIAEFVRSALREKAEDYGNACREAWKKPGGPMAILKGWNSGGLKEDLETYVTLVGWRFSIRRLMPVCWVVKRKQSLKRKHTQALPRPTD